jgi:hypothetical protein
MKVLEHPMAAKAYDVLTDASRCMDGDFSTAANK